MTSYGMKPLKKRPAPTQPATSSAPEQGVAMSNPLSGMPLNRAERDRVMGITRPKADSSTIAPSSADAPTSSSPTQPKAATAAADMPERDVLSFGEEPKQETLLDRLMNAEYDEDGNIIPTQDEAEETQEPEDQDSPADEPIDDENTERYLVMRDYCLRGKGVSCNRCQMACPMQAISFGDDDYPVIDDAKCSRCGICSGICDGFSSNQITLEDMRNRIMRAASINNQVFLTCHENVFDDMEPAENVVVLPCLAAIPPQLYALLLAEEVNVTIACDLSYCEDCFRAPGFGGTLYSAALNTAEAWTGKKVGFVAEVPEKESITASIMGEGSRRELFTGITSSASKIASGEYRTRTNDVLQEFFAMQERMRASVAEELADTIDIRNLDTETGNARALFPRHDLLLSINKVDPEIGQNIVIGVSETDASACCQSVECCNVCPTGARKSTAPGYYTYDATYCIGCGLCVEACPAGACHMIDVALDEIPGEVEFGSKSEAPASPSQLYERPTKTLIDAEK